MEYSLKRFAEVKTYYVYTIPKNQVMFLTNQCCLLGIITFISQNNNNYYNNYLIIVNYIINNYLIN